MPQGPYTQGAYTMYQRHTYGTTCTNYTQSQRHAMAQIHGVVSSNYHTSTTRVVCRKVLCRHYAKMVAAGTITLAQAAAHLRQRRQRMAVPGQRIAELYAANGG